MPDPVFAHTEQKDREVQNVSYDFSGQVVLISGAAHGQGRTHAIAFAKAGANLALCDLGPTSRIFLNDGHGVRARGHRGGVPQPWRRGPHPICDVARRRETQAFVDDTVSSSARSTWRSPTRALRDRRAHRHGEMDAVVDADLTGVFLTLRRVAREIVNAGGGSLVATGSVHCFTACPKRATSPPSAASRACASRWPSSWRRTRSGSTTCPTRPPTPTWSRRCPTTRSRPRRAAARHHRRLDMLDKIGPHRADRGRAGGHALACSASST